MSESNKCCECNQGELPCTCKCHSTTPSYDSWEKEFDAVFGSYQNGPPNSIPDTTKHQDFTGENVKVFIQVLLDRQQAAPTPSLSEGGEWEEEFDEHYAEIGIVGDRKFREFLPYTYQHLKDFIRTLLSQTLSNERQRMVAIGNSLRDEIRSRYRGGDGDMSDDFYDGEEAAIATYQQKIKSLDS